MLPTFLTFREDAEEDVVPALVRCMEPTVDQPDAPHRSALSMAVLEATRAGKLRHEGRQEQGVVVLCRDLNGLVVLVLAHLNVAAHVDHQGVYGQVSSPASSSTASLPCLPRSTASVCPPRDVTGVAHLIFRFFFIVICSYFCLLFCFCMFFGVVYFWFQFFVSFASPGFILKGFSLFFMCLSLPVFVIC